MLRVDIIISLQSTLQMLLILLILFYLFYLIIGKILIFKSAHSNNVSELQCTHTALVTHK